MEQEKCPSHGTNPNHNGALWINYTSFGRAHLLWAQLEADFGKAGGASTYLQMVNMVKIEFTDSTELLLQIQQFLENYNRITLNGHSKLSKDLATFTFCSSLPSSYEQTTQQYLDGITAITNYKIQDIVARVLQEESRRKAQSVQTGTSINKFSTVKNLGQNVLNVVKPTTAHEITGQGDRI